MEAITKGRGEENERGRMAKENTKRRGEENERERNGEKIRIEEERRMRR